MKIIKILITVVLILSLHSCSSTKNAENESEVLTEKKYEPNLDKRLEKYSGTMFDKAMKKKTSSVDFASSNPMWRASLNVLSDIPLVNADYVGGIITSDWYSNGSKESIKINIQFTSNEILASSINITAFKKICDIDSNCKITKSSDEFVKNIKDKIISNIREIKIQDKKNK